MQNVNNMELLLNEKNIKNTLSVFDISNQAIPSNSNSIYLLSHHLEQSITNSLYNETINDIDINNKIRFMKMNFGEVIYGKENDIIKTNKNHVSVFVCNRLFDFETETYFNLKIDNIDKHNIFIGFINSEEDKYQKAFGFHKLINNKIYRRSLYIPSVSFSINDIKSIGCYYTPKFVYLIINERLTPYRISHPKLKSYIPIIYVINDELEINVLQNVTIVDRSSEKFDFLNINNISEDSYKEKDTKENFDQKIFMNKYIFNKYEEYKSDNLLIGQMIEVSKIALYPYLLEMNEMIPPILLDYEDNAGIVKDINLIDGNKYLFDVEVESYNNKKLSKETIKLKSRYIQNEQTSFFKIIENRTNTKFGLNSSFSLKHLIDKPNNDLNSIKKFVKIKTIFDNSKSLAILMSRFLVFILLDYLRFSKSNLLQEEGINSNEMKLIINSLVHSLRTIALFSPDFELDANKIANDDYLIFQNEQDENEMKNNSLTEYYKMAGNYYFFNISFIMFLKKSESFLSPHFLSNLISKSYEISIQGNSIKITDLYNLIQSKYKLESIFPLSNEFSINKFDNTKFNSSDHKITEFDIDNISGFVPILISSIPDQLPSVIFNDRRFRLSSDQVTYIQLADRRYHSIQFNWVYNIDSLKNKYKEYSYDGDDNINNYELEFGLFTLFEHLPEFIVESSFGFINILFSVFRALNFTEHFLDQKNKEMLIFKILEKVFSLTLNKNPLVYPFIKPIISTLSSLIKFSDLLLSKEASESFEYLSLNSNVLYPIENFPTLSSEAPVIFSIYSSLINAFSKEKVIIDLTKSNNSFVVNNISDLFDCFCNVNDELFSINDIHQFNKLNFTEGTFVKDNHNRTSIQTLEKKKNYRLFYQLYYYSILLSNENNLPYPKFLFFHDWIRQHFGSFRMAVTNGDINKYEKSNAKENKKLLYKSDVINNDFDLECSYNLISIFNVQNGKKDEGEEEEVEQEQLTSKSFKVIVHQLKDDKQIELNQQGEKVLVSFPLEFQIFNLDENDKKQLKKGDSFIIEFTPSIEQEKKYFIEHYNQFQIEFNQFISLGKYDTKLSEFAIISKKKNEKESEEDSSSASNNYDDMGVVIATLIQGDPLAEHFIHDSYMLSFYLQHSFNVSSLEEFVKKLKSETSRDDYKFYELERIPTKIEFNFNPTPSEFNESITSLRYWILSYYNSLIEEILINYTEKVESTFNDDNESIWGINISLSGKEESLYSKQIIRPAMSMNTESKFRFINQILMNDKKEESNLHLDFNRFESRKFFDNFTKKPENENENKDDKQQRPLFVQLIEQIGDDGIKELKVPRGNPFHAELVDEQAIDAGGPAREVFSSLIIEIMNNNVGIFTFNPNHNHKTEDTNKEDLIPNTQFYGQIYDMIDTSCRFLYAGALIAVCIVSDLPQQMKLASFVWEFLSKNKIESIESIYEVDEEFKKIIEEAEDCKKKLENLQMTEDEFNKVFMQSFTIKDSFDNHVDLIFGGSKKKVTKDNLSQFIELAKNFRIHEFDHELNELKRGFDIIMTKKEITSILRPNELKLLVCGEPNCPVEQMKNLVVILVDNSESHQNDFGEYCAKMKKMFWNVMESLTVDERVGFIRFSSGTNGLPAVGLKWENDLKVTIFSKEKRMKDGKVLPEAHTCFSSVDIPYFESEEELARSIRTAIENGGLITDSNEIPNGIEHYLT